MCDVSEIESVVVAKQATARAARSLRANGQDGWADWMEHHLGEMEGRYATKEAFYSIGVLCHGRALGDAVPRGGSPEAWERWHVQIANLRDACGRAFDELECLA